MKPISADQRQHAASRSTSGFTLLELLVVIAIIGLLASFLLPAVFKARTKANIGAVKGQLSQLRTAVEAYYTDYDTFPPMGNDWLGGVYFPTEDIGTDQKAPFRWDNAALKWVANGSAGPPWQGPYTGPDTNGTEMNYVLEPEEDLGLDNVPNDPYDNSSGVPNFFSDNDGVTTEPSIGEGNGKLDGTYLDRMADLISRADQEKLIDIFADRTYYHYYAGYVTGQTEIGMDEYPEYTNNNAATGALDEYAADPPPYYNKWVLYSNGPDGKDHGLHNYYITTQDGEDVGTDAFVSDPADQDGDYILFEPSDQGGDGTAEENDNISEAFVSVTIRETGYIFDPAGTEEQSVTGSITKLDGPDGFPDFDYDTRLKKKSRRPLPDGTTYDGVIMLYGP